MNILDAAIYGTGIVAVISGYRVGLIRSLVTILGYVVAAPIAVLAASFVTPAMADESLQPWGQNSLLFFGIFLIAGMVMGHLFRSAVGDFMGRNIHIADRLSGALLGATRVALVGVTLVLVFDHILPLDQQPAFLKESTVKPVLSLIGQSGLKSLPPELTTYIDRLKQEALQKPRA